MKYLGNSHKDARVSSKSISAIWDHHSFRFKVFRFFQNFPQDFWFLFYQSSVVNLVTLFINKYFLSTYSLRRCAKHWDTKLKSCFLLCTNTCMCTCSAVSDSLPPHALQFTRLLCPQNIPGKNTGVGCHFLIQGISPPDPGTRSASPVLAGRVFTTTSPPRYK